MVRSRGFAWISLFLLALVPAAPLQAGITPGGDVAPADYSWWTGGGDSLTQAYIGKTGTGSVVVDLGSDLSSYSGSIGKYAGSAGDVTVAGSGSTWTNSHSLLVGYGDQGTLNIANGGAVSNTSGYIGFESGSAGLVTVAGSGSTWTNSGKLYVGSSGQGILNIADGGVVSNTSGIIGFYSGSAGVVTVAGSGSTWTNSGGIDVGYDDQGTLSIADGGTVEVGGTLNVWGFGTLNIGVAGKVSVGDALVLTQDSTLAAKAGATIHMTGSAFQNESTNSADLAGLGNLTLIFEGGSGYIDPFEVAGEDMGAVLAGFDSNFALGTLQLGGADIGQVQLVDTFDNQLGFAGSEALYVKNLVLGVDSVLDLNGLNLYYYKGWINGTVLGGGGSLVQIDWIKGDANWDTRVDGSDLNLLLTGWGTGTTWQEGDFDGNGLVDGSDLNWLLSNWTYPPASSASVPEPATMLLLAIGACAGLLGKGGQGSGRLAMPNRKA